MKKYNKFLHYLNNIFLILTIVIILLGCIENKSKDVIDFGTSADYPPFEYKENGTIKGFDIELATMLAKKIGRDAIFHNMRFSGLLTALQSRRIDAAISTITATEERSKNFDFSDPYYLESIAIIYKKSKPIVNVEQLLGKKIVYQIGTTMEIWAKRYAENAIVLTMDNSNQAIDALKTGDIDAVLIDASQAAIFTKQNSALSYLIIVKSGDGYCIAFKKNSELKLQINAALTELNNNGELQKLKTKWFNNKAKEEIRR